MELKDKTTHYAFVWRASYQVAAGDKDEFGSIYGGFEGLRYVNQAHTPL